jgi:flagellar basal-body rod protein FlgG
MPGLIESATAILRSSERRLETISNNVANLATAGFKRQVGFSDLLAAAPGDAAGTTVSFRPDLSQGKLSSSGNPLDLAISGAGFFQLSKGGEILYSRQGHFSLAQDGTVVTPLGYALQQAGGGDLVLESAAAVKILADGTVLDGERPIGRVGMYSVAADAPVEAVGGSMFRLGEDQVEEASGATVRQGMIEASNVAVGDEIGSYRGGRKPGCSGSLPDWGALRTI